MKYIILILSLVIANVAVAANLRGVVYNENSSSPLDECSVTLLQNGRVVNAVKTNFQGLFNISYKKNQTYTFQVSKSGYKTESVEFYTDKAFIENNPSIEVYMQTLELKPKFEKMQEGVIKDIPNPDIMEDIGNLSELPEGYKIIEAKPLKYKEDDDNGFNVNRNAAYEKTNVNVEVLKEEFNKEDIDRTVYADQDKFPSCYYAEGIIFYGPGKALLTNSVREILDGIALKLNSDPFSSIKLIAYADADKEALIGDYISKLRVEEITKYLMSKGVEFSQLNISVMGNIALDNECYQGVACSEFEHQQNRKVDLYFIE